MIFIELCELLIAVAPGEQADAARALRPAFSAPYSVRVAAYKGVATALTGAIHRYGLYAYTFLISYVCIQRCCGSVEQFYH